MPFEIVNTQALKEFREKGELYVKDFQKIKQDFEDYNIAFLAEFEGRGAEKYKRVSELITEKVSDFEDVFRTICDCLVNPALQDFEDLDQYLDEQNESMKIKDENQGADSICQK